DCRPADKASIDGGNENIVDNKILAACSPHPDNRPGILDRSLVWGKPHGPDPRRSCFGQLRLVAVHDDTGAKEPGRMIDAAGKIPVPPNAVAAVDRIGPAQRPQRAGAAKIGGVTTELASDIHGEPTHGE